MGKSKMSDRISALGNTASCEGLVQISETGPHGMITVRGDLSAPEFCAAVEKITGFEIPGPGAMVGDLRGGIAWMSPDELLVLCTAEKEDELCNALSVGLKDMHALVANVSDARAVFELKGAHIRDVLAKLAPVDMSREQMCPGMLRRTRLAQVPAAFWIEQESARIVCFRSVAQYMFDLLQVAAQPGSEVGYHQ
jgi:sarcosine oxidase subunit gamma